VKYLHNGKLIYSKWCSHANNKEAAEIWAVENRERLINEYFDKRSKKKPYIDMYAILKNYYAPNSQYLQVDIKRGRAMGDTSRNSYHNFINKQFVPYLKKQGIKTIEQIDTPFMSRFQNYMLADRKIKGATFAGVKPQTLNHYISYISKIFDHLLQEGMIKANPCKNLLSIKIKKTDLKVTGCFEISKIKGVFNKKWKDELSYLLSLVIYTTDMRNSEIERIQLKDFFMIDNYHFLDIPESKSENGERIVPIHDFVYRKITLFSKRNGIDKDGYIFKLSGCKKLGSKRYKAAYTEMAGYMGYDENKMKEENIRFYSGRHFWKTLMDSENLGDIEEYFMGHKVSGDVAKRYNHKDKQGKKKLLEKTRKVFQILDKYVFT
jgi:site-specific recombinase XerD